VAEREVRLGHADRQVAEAQILVELQRLRRGGEFVDAAGAVDAHRHGLDLFAQRQVVRVQEPEIGRAFLGRGPDGVGQVFRSRAALAKWRLTTTFRAPAASATSRIAATSASVSPG